MRILLIEIKRAPTKWFIPLLIACAIYVAVVMIRPGVLLWSDISAGLNQSSGLVNPLLAGLMAWEGGRRAGGGFRWRLGGARRDPLLPRVAHVAGLLFWPALAALIVVVGLTIYMSAAGGYGHPVWGWLFATTAGGVASAVIGYFTGALTGPKWFIAPVVALGIYFGWIIVSQPQFLPHGVSQLYPTAVNGTNPFVKYIGATFVGQVIWYLAASLVLVLVLSSLVRGLTLRQCLVSMVGVAALATGVTLIQTTNGQITTGYNARGYQCQDQPVEICVHRAFSDGLSQLEMEFQDFNHRVRGTELVASRLEHNVAGKGDNPSEGARSLYVENLGSNFATYAVDYYVEKYGGIRKCRSQESYNSHSVIDSWLKSERSWQLQSPTEAGDAARRFTGLTEAQRHSWFVQNEDAVLTCRLTATDLP